MKAQVKPKRRGFTLIEFLVIVAVLAVLVAIYFPALRPSRPRGLYCVNNLKQVALAFRQWSLDNDDRFPMQVSVTNGGTMELVGKGNVYVHFLVMSNELNTPKVLFCPQESDPKRRTATTFASTVRPGMPYQAIPFTNDLSVSYFVGLDANGTKPQTFLAGDRNLIGGTMLPNRILLLTTNDVVRWGKDLHNSQGNVALADGSVQGFSSSRLREALANTGVETNRLAMP